MQPRLDHLMLTIHQKVCFMWPAGVPLARDLVDSRDFKAAGRNQINSPVSGADWRVPFQELEAYCSGPCFI